MDASQRELQKKLITELNKLPVHNLTADKKEISIRCKFCGDSRKNSKSSHLYINIDPPPNTPFRYYCQRCKAKGYVNSEFLKSLNIQNSNLIVDIEKNNMKCKKKNSGIKLKLTKAKLKLPDYKNNKFNRTKLAYINSRLGTQFTLKDLKDYKIILNLYDVLDYNKINYLTCKDLLADTLDENFIGFVSYDNNYIVMRNLSKKILPNIRYYNYNVFNSYNNTKKFYFLPNKIDCMKLQTTVVLTEGVFDLLSVFFNIKNQEKDNIIYVAVCGIGYNNVINEIIRMGFLNINLEIYGDSDQDVRMYKQIKEQFKDFISKATLYTNSLAKDFGNIKDGIKIKRMNL